LHTFNLIKDLESYFLFSQLLNNYLRHLETEESQKEAYKKQFSEDV